MEIAARNVIFPGSVGLAQAHPLTKPLAMGDGLPPTAILPKLSLMTVHDTTHKVKRIHLVRNWELPEKLVPPLPRKNRTKRSCTKTRKKRHLVNTEIAGRLHENTKENHLVNTETSVERTLPLVSEAFRSPWGRQKLELLRWCDALYTYITASYSPSAQNVKTVRV